jgi:hypothetical protein
VGAAAQTRVLETAAIISWLDANPTERGLLLSLAQRERAVEIMLCPGEPVAFLPSGLGLCAAHHRRRAADQVELVFAADERAHRPPPEPVR